MSKYGRINKIFLRRSNAQTKIFEEKKYKHRQTIQKIKSQNQATITSNNKMADDRSPLIHELIETVDCSVRLMNCVKSPEFPFKTVAEYKSHDDPFSEIMRIKSAGTKTARELEDIINNSLYNPNSAIAKKSNYFIEQINLENRVRNEALEIFSRYKFPEIVFTQNISNRLNNVLQSYRNEDLKIFPALSNCLQNPNDFEMYFLAYPNMGRKTLVELKKLIARIATYILEKNEIEDDEINYILALLNNNKHKHTNLDISSIIDKLYAINKKTTPIDLSNLLRENIKINSHNKEILEENDIALLIQNMLPEKSFDIIRKRNGMEGERILTLEEISKIYDCTRERIRQIEKKAIKKLLPIKNILCNFLETQQKNIEALLFDDTNYFNEKEAPQIFKKIVGIRRIAIIIAHEEINLFLDSKCKRYKNYWINPSLDDIQYNIIKNSIDNELPSNNIKARINEAIPNLSWPINLNNLIEILPDISPVMLEKVLKEEFSAKILNNRIELEPANLSASLRLIFTLRYAEKPLTLSEICTFHKHLFGIDISKHAAGAVLSRLSKTLIVARGEYTLYEKLNLNSDQIQNIREDCWNYLNKIGEYISSKKIFDDLYSGKHRYGPHFSPYMLFGILQDDKRFLAKRGFMIGLNIFSQNSFKSLASEIFRIVDDNAPIKVRDIQKQISVRRKVLDATIIKILDASTDYVKVGPATYDKMSKILVTKEKYQQFKYAIEISLLDNSQTLFSLINRIKSVGFDINKFSILSLLDKFHNIKRKNDIVQLLEISDEIKNYNKKYLSLLKTLKSDDINDNLNNKILESEFPFIFPVDFRNKRNSEITSATSSSDDEINNLFEEFKF